MSDALLDRFVPVLAEVPGVVAVVLGGSRARGTAGPTSDYDIGLYYGPSTPLDTAFLQKAMSPLVDDPASATVTPVGGWGPRIVGGGWLSVHGQKVDLLYRNVAAVGQVITDCRNGRIVMDYQPGHPHGFCSATWMGEIALCQSLHDPHRVIADLKSLTSPYPDGLREALVRMFHWEIAFSIENGEIAGARGDQTHVAGCAYRALCCMGQVLFAANRRYLINEKRALIEAANFPRTIAGLSDRVAHIWQAIGQSDFAEALTELKSLGGDVTEVAREIAPEVR